MKDLDKDLIMKSFQQNGITTLNTEYHLRLQKVLAGKRIDEEMEDQDSQDSQDSVFNSQSGTEDSETLESESEGSDLGVERLEKVFEDSGSDESFYGFKRF